jgi:hypothetical protein
MENLLLFRWQYYPKWSIEIIKSLSKSLTHFVFRNRQANLKIHAIARDPNRKKIALKKKDKEDSHSLTSKLTPKQW